MKVVCIGGGTGVSQVVKAWANIGAEVTAIVATTDNGGCSGRLRDSGSPVPWGDLRKVIEALASPKQAFYEALSLRFRGDNHLSQHCVGNLLLEAYYQQTQSVTKAVNKLVTELNVKHQVLPMSEIPVDLVALQKNGILVHGEKQIDALEQMPHHLFLSTDICAPQQSLEAIAQADLITIGPGSLMTSVLPVLLVQQVQEALLATKATTVFIHNLQPENSPVSQYSQQQLKHWLNGQIDTRIFDSELTADRWVGKNSEVALPQCLQCDQGGHSQQSLKSAFNFIAQQLVKKLNRQPTPVFNQGFSAHFTEFRHVG